MKQLFANNVKSTLSSSITPASTTVQVKAGEGSRFPSPAAGEYVLVTLELSGVIEIVKCTFRSGDILTVQRGQEGTLASSFSTGTMVEVRATAGTFASFLRQEQRLVDTSSVEDLTAPINMQSNTYICHTGDDGGNPIVAVKDTDAKWKFTTHSRILVTGSVTTGVNSATQITSINIRDLVRMPAPGKYIIQFTSGPNAGVPRIVFLSANNTVSWANPLPSTPVINDGFEIYQSTNSVLKDITDAIDDAIAYGLMFALNV